MFIFRNKSACFYSTEMLAPRLSPKLENHPLSAVSDRLFNVFTVTLHIYMFYPIPFLQAT
jgi:hypothetical protein